MQRNFSQQEYISARNRLHQLNQRAKGVDQAVESEQRRQSRSDEQPLESVAKTNKAVGTLPFLGSNGGKTPHGDVAEVEAQLEETEETFERSIRTAGLR